MTKHFFKNCFDNFLYLLLLFSSFYVFHFSMLCSLYRTLETLFWSVFNLVELDTLDIDIDHYFTEWTGKTMFGTFNVIAIVVLLNMLIAMMSTSYAFITVSH